MLEKNKRYLNIKENLFYEVIDYIYYNGTNEHAFTFKIGFELKKIIIKDSELDLYLLNFEIKKSNKMENKNYIEETKDILMQTIKDLKNGIVDVNVANGISKTSQTLINLHKLELDIKYKK
jgi:hypothetical protein